jgi:hypothetical protein
MQGEKIQGVSASFEWSFFANFIPKQFKMDCAARQYKELVAKRDRLIQPKPEKITKLNTGTKVHYQLPLLESYKMGYRLLYKPTWSRCVAPL